MTLNIMQASNQWATRPDDERFWTLDEMHQRTLSYREHSTESLQLASDCRLTTNSRGIAMQVGQSGNEADVGHYAFTQVCRQLSAPAGYLRQLSSALAVECLEHSRERDPAQDRQRNLLIDTTGIHRLRATTSDRYVRVWNHELVEALQELQVDGWVVPPARPSGHEAEGRTRIATEEDCIDFGDSPLTVKPGDTIAPAGLYASDHDMFAFLINPRIEIDNGLSPSGMRRGTMIRQSEVGSCSIWKLDFLFDTVCGNHIVWDAREVRETRVRHMGSAVEDNWVAMIRNITEEAETSARQQEAEIRRAQEIVLGSGKEEIMALLFKNRWATKRVAGKAFDIAEDHSESHGNPHSLWGMVSGLTRLSQQTGYADDRAAMDRAAGKMLAHCLN
jgi:hypothetical protein